MRGVPRVVRIISRLNVGGPAIQALTLTAGWSLSAMRPRWSEAWRVRERAPWTIWPPSSA